MPYKSRCRICAALQCRVQTRRRIPLTARPVGVLRRARGDCGHHAGATDPALLVVSCPALPSPALPSPAQPCPAQPCPSPSQSPSPSPSLPSIAPGGRLPRPFLALLSLPSYVLVCRHGVSVAVRSLAHRRASCCRRASEAEGPQSRALNERRFPRGSPREEIGGASPGRSQGSGPAFGRWRGEWLGRCRFRRPLAPYVA